RAAKPAVPPPILAPADRKASATATTGSLGNPLLAAEAVPVDLDLDALERAAAEAQTPYFQQIHDLPPPPAAVLGKKRISDVPAGSYRSVTPGQDQTQHVVSPPPAPPPLDKHAERPKGPVPASAGRYAPTRPAAIFANSRPAEGASIFGEDLISEKSLDEVI